jgi:hypothetical protein
MKEAEARPEGDTLRVLPVLVRAGWRASQGCGREALIAILACAAEWMMP